MLIYFLLLALMPVRGEDYYPPPDAKGGWRTLTDLEDSLCFWHRYTEAR
jgi:hypothetical protein